MAIERRNPLRDILHLQQRMNRLFEEMLARDTGAEETEATPPGGWKPPVDVVEQAERYLLRVDLPGVSPAEVQVEVEEDTLVLRGDRPMDPAIPRESYLRNERPHGRFHLRLALPPSVDRERVKASHGNGVLEVALPKRRAEPAGRIRVQVQ
jgi:HSP20 family protein